MRVGEPTAAIDLVRTFQDEAGMDDKTVAVLLCEFIESTSLRARSTSTWPRRWNRRKILRIVGVGLVERSLWRVAPRRWNDQPQSEEALLLAGRPLR